MLAARTERARPGRFSFVELSVLMTLAVWVAAQNTAPSQAAPATHLPALPRSCLEQNHPSEKIAALLESIHDHPTAGAYNTLGVLYAQADRVSCGIVAFEASLKLQDQNWEAHYNLALALLRNGERARAMHELQTAIQQKPDSVSSHFALASVFEDEKKWGNAEEQFRSALKIDPHFTQAAIKLSEVLITEGKPQPAVACLEGAVKQAPPDQAAPLKAALGIAYAESGEMGKALASLKDVVNAQPDSSNPHFTLGLLYAREGQFKDEERAVTEFREALRLDQGMDPARIALGRVLISLQKYSDAAPVVLEYTRHQPKDAQGFYALGQVYRGLKRSDAAVDALERAAVLDPRDAAIRFDLGMLLVATGKTRAAIPQFEAAERFHPSDISTHNELALLLEQTGDEDGARVERAKLAALKSHSDKESAIAGFNERAGEYLTAGNAKAAAESYGKALQLSPRDAKLHYNLSLALDRLGDFPSERQELARTIELDPHLAVAQNQLGLLALRSGQQAEAEQRFKKTLAIDPR